MDETQNCRDSRDSRDSRESRDSHGGEGRPSPGTPGVHRRVLLHGAVTGLGVVGLGLAGCGGGDDGATTPAAGPSSTGAQSPTAAQSSGGGQALVAAGEVPVGGGVVLADEKIVVTQPTAGTYKAFSATCTHQNCTVGSVADGTINCPCHGSRYAVADGSVVRGPARTGLRKEKVAVDGDRVVLL